MWHSLTYHLAENPWYLAGTLGVIGVGFLLALRVTQDGKNLVRAMVALGLAGVVLLVEQVWVTEAERIERVVVELADALAHSDADRVIGLMDEHLTFSVKSPGPGDELDLDVARSVIREVEFDWVHVSRLSTSAGAQSHKGTAEFRLGVSGTYHMTMGARPFMGNSDWSLGFRRTPAGDWKITRITAVALPPYVPLPLRYKTRKDATVAPPIEPIQAPRHGRMGRPPGGR